MSEHVPPSRVLMVCTANLCRSPMAQYLFMQAAEQRSAAGRLEVSSAGTQAAIGVALHPLAAAALSEKSVPHEHFRSRQLTSGVIGAADLILTATADHRRQVAELVPSAVRRTFTLLQFARLATVMPPADPTDLVAYLDAHVPFARSQAGPGNSPTGDDIADPVGGKLAAFRRCIGEIGKAVDVIADRLLSGV